MADNIQLSAGSGGAVLAADDIASVFHQRVKVEFGTDGNATDVSASNPMPVVQTGTPALPTGAATEATLASLDAKVNAEVTKDYDTGAGTEAMKMVGLALPASGGSVAGGTASNPVRTDPTGTTPQPVTDGGGSFTVDSPQLPATLGQTTKAASLPVTLASDQDALPVTGTFFQATQPVSAAALPLPSGAATEAKQPALGTAGAASADVITIQGVASMTAVKTDGSGVTQPVSAAALPLPSGAATEATLAAQSAKLPATLGQKAMAASMAVALASDQSAIPITVASIPSHPVTNAGTFAVQAGQAAHDAAISGNPVRVAGRGMSADYAAVTTGDVADILTTLLGKQVNIPHALPGATWSYAAAAGGLVNTSGVTAKAAAGAGVRNYVTAIQVINSHATISTEVVIRDGASGTVLHRGWAQAAGGGYAIQFPTPLRGTADTLIEIAEVTATATTGVLVNLQGYTAAE